MFWNQVLNSQNSRSSKLLSCRDSCKNSRENIGVQASFEDLTEISSQDQTIRAKIELFREWGKDIQTEDKDHIEEEENDHIMIINLPSKYAEKDRNSNNNFEY